LHGTPKKVANQQSAAHTPRFITRQDRGKSKEMGTSQKKKARKWGLSMQIDLPVPFE